MQILLHTEMSFINEATLQLKAMVQAREPFDIKSLLSPLTKELAGCQAQIYHQQAKNKLEGGRHYFRFIAHLNFLFSGNTLGILIL